MSELYHHGIGGMRWGFRRFQNEDGSLTPEGQLRYNKGKERASRAKATEAYKTKKYKQKLALKTSKQRIKAAAKEAKYLKEQQEKVSKKTAEIAKRKSASEMSDEELRNEVNRLGMELDYNLKKYKSEKGITVFDKINAAADTTIGNAVLNLGVDVARNAANRTVNDFVDSKFDLEKVARIGEINARTNNNKRLNEASVFKVESEGKKHLAEAQKHLQEAKNNKAKTVNEINENRKTNNQTRKNTQAEADENLKNKKILNLEEQQRSHQDTLTKKVKEQSNRKEIKAVSEAMQKMVSNTNNVTDLKTIKDYTNNVYTVEVKKTPVDSETKDFILASGSMSIDQLKKLANS